MENIERKKNIAILEVLLCAALWSTAGIFIKLIPWNSFVISGVRSAIAGTVVFVYMRVRRYPFAVNRHSLFSAVTLCGTMILFVTANKLTTAANAIVLQFTSPVFIMLISALFLGTRFSKADILAVAVTMGGISLFFFEQLGSGGLLGNFLALGAGLSFGCYYISLGRCPENERLSGIVIANLLTALVGVPFLFTTHPALSGAPLLYIVLLGVFQLGIPYALLAAGSEYCPPLACSLLGALEPLLNPVWVFLFDGEAPGPFALIGGAVVIATITVWCVYKDRKAKAEAAVQ